MDVCLKKDLDIGGYTLPLSARTFLMGVLNVTPDSFSDGGRYMCRDLAVEKAVRMVESGADIIDIGGESSRPGARSVSAEEELERVMPVIRALKGKVDVPLSIDTWKSEVARAALAEGVSMVNDITALSGDRDMAEAVAGSGASIVLMHMKGRPRDMQDSPLYDDVMGEISSYLSGAIAAARESGIDDNKIIVDPGIGFGKTLEHNLVILRDLEKLKLLGKPILVGTSRKSFIGVLTGRDAEQRIFGTAASVAVAIMNGADIIRVHDVDQMRDVARIMDAIVKKA
jgi:dihydropteroate synthase